MKKDGGKWTHEIHIPKNLSVSELTTYHQLETAVAKRLPDSKPRVFPADDLVPIFAEIGIYHYDYRPQDNADHGCLRDPVCGYG